METREINNNETIQKLDTTFEESLETGFTVTYVFDVLWKRYFALTNDWQYTFIWRKVWDKIEVLDKQEVFSKYNKNNEMTYEEILDEYWITEYCLHVDSMWWWNWFSVSANHMRKFSITNITEFDDYLIDLEKNRFKWNINNVLD